MMQLETQSMDILTSQAHRTLGILSYMSETIGFNLTSTPEFLVDGKLTNEIPEESNTDSGDDEALHELVSPDTDQVPSEVRSTNLGVCSRDDGAPEAHDEPADKDVGYVSPPASYDGNAIQWVKVEWV